VDPDSAQLPLLLLISTQSELWIYGGSFLLLLLASALVSGAEVAFFSLEATDLEEDNERFTYQELVVKLLDRPKKLLATILIANNTVNISTVLIFSMLSETWFTGITASWLKFTLEVVVVTFAILLFGEIFPKVYASRNPVQFANFMAVPLRVLDVIFTPLSLPMRYITLQIQDRLGSKKSNITISQLSQALELTDDNDTTQEEQQILQGIVNFGNTDTKNVMRNRTDVFAIDERMGFAELIKQVIAHGYSRIPVYKDNIDQITGVLYVKDLLPHKDRKNFEWLKLLRETYFVPENKKLDDLLQEFQEQKKHLAIVVDEYGGTSGLITMEDIIEEIVGDISDEFDDENLIFSKLDYDNIIFEGKTSLKDFYRVMGIIDHEVSHFEDAKGESESIAGFLLEQMGFFPRKLHKISFHNYTFTIEVMDKKRIKQVKCTRES
jgi:gliding motility-associated protein GldE